MFTVGHGGAVTSKQATSTPATLLSLQKVLNTSFSASYTYSKASSISVVGATDGSPRVLPLEEIGKVRMLALRCALSGANAMTVKLTTAAGALQELPLSDLLFMHLPRAGDEVTAIQLTGTGLVEYVIAGEA